jgi:hypothetical protein
MFGEQQTLSMNIEAHVELNRGIDVESTESYVFQ